MTELGLRRSERTASENTLAVAADPTVAEETWQGPPGGAPRSAGANRTSWIALIGASIGLAVGLRLVLSGLETAPALFLSVATASWFLDRRSAYLAAGAAVLAWTAAAVLTGPLDGALASGLVLAAALAVVSGLLSAAREREAVLVANERRREQARALLGAQLRESVVSIDVAVPLLVDPTTLDRTQGAAYDQIRRHARGLARVANDLLTLDQVDTKKMELSLITVDLAAFTVEVAGPRIPHDRATIVTPAAPVPVLADPERLRQVIDHVLQNALKFSPESAGIMVSVSVSEDEARVSVRDHGIGLSADDLRILFTRYGRIRDARTANIPGMGLGLYLARLIAEAHGGELTAASSGRGLGATFTLILPRAGRPRRRRPATVPASSFWD